MIRCITFDLDDTLWAVNPVITQANNSLFEWLAVHAPEFTRCYQLKDLVGLRKQVLEEQPTIAHSVSKIRIEQLRLGLLTAGYSSKDAELLTQRAFEVFIHARQQISFFEHAREMLSVLKERGYQLGALSNGNADIAKVGLSDLIDFQLKADDVGTMKPHPLMFQQMLNHTRLRPEQVIHVGDNPDHDVAGAHALGIWTILVNVVAQNQSPLATQHVNCLADVPNAVDEICQAANSRFTL